MNILFYDPVCPKPYTLSSLEQDTLGGTEATTLRVANELSKKNSVHLARRGHSKDITFLRESNANIIYISPENAPLEPIEAVVTLRDAGCYKTNKVQYKEAMHYLWLHDVVAGEYLTHLEMHLKTEPEVQIVAVSEWHRTNIFNALKPLLPNTKLQVTVIYPPLAEYCVKKEVPYDPFKLVFFSSPHKGLDAVLKIFSQLYSIDNRYTLYISNPGYFPSLEGMPAGVINLGILKHKEVIEHARSALCMFYPQTIFPETFGLVYIESNSVGTPVIAHNIGAASEVLDHHKQIINCNDINQIVKTVIDWNKGERLIVSAHKKFTAKEVVKQWERLFNYCG